MGISGQQWSPMTYELVEGVTKKQVMNRLSRGFTWNLEVYFQERNNSLCNILIFKFNDLRPRFMGGINSVNFRSCWSVDLIDYLSNDKTSIIWTLLKNDENGGKKGVEKGSEKCQTKIQIVKDGAYKSNYDIELDWLPGYPSFAWWGDHKAQQLRGLHLFFV